MAETAGWTEFRQEQRGSRVDFLTDYKIPVGRWASDIFNWLQVNGGWFFDGLAEIMTRLIDGFLWVLQTPPELVVVAFFALLAWWLQKSWKMALFVTLGFLFIINQGYWKETTESLTLVVSACLVCMAIGVPVASPPRIARTSTG